MRRMLAELDRPLPRRRLLSRKPSATLRPASFALYADPLDRFEFRYPAEWRLQDGASPTVLSPSLGLFARVDLLPPRGDLRELLEARFPGLTVHAAREGRVEGTLKSGARAYRWTCAIFALRGTRVAFSTAAVADGSLQAYRRNILAAIRRHFRLSPGLRS